MDINYEKILEDVLLNIERDIATEAYIDIQGQLFKVYKEIKDNLPYSMDGLIKEYEDLLKEKNKIREKHFLRKGIKIGVNLILDLKKD